MNQYTDEIAQNPNYIAYDLLNSDPLNENSVEYLCSQADIFRENALQSLKCEGLDEDLEVKYS